MQELCKKSLLVFIFLVLSSFVYAFDECKGTMPQDEIPCQIILPVNTSTTPCNTINISIYNTSTSLSNDNMHQYSSFLCYHNFTFTSQGTYTFLYGTGDSGSIIVEEGMEMIYLIWFFGLVIVAMAVIGFMYKNVVYHSLTALGLMIFGLFIHINGFNSTYNLLTQFIAVVFVALGLYFLIPVFEWAIDELNVGG